MDTTMASGGDGVGGASTTLSVFVAEDQFLLRRGLEELLQAHGLVLAGSAEDAAGLVPAVLASTADVALLDIRMPPTNTDEGVRAAVALRRHRPGFPVVLLSQYVEQLYLDELLADGRGGVGYLLKDRVFDDTAFIATLAQVAGGETVVDPEVVARLARLQPEHGPLAGLTAREYEVLAHMAQGHANARIAADLVVSEKAVQKHINAIFTKLDLSGDETVAPRVQAVLAFLGGDR